MASKTHLSSAIFAVIALMIFSVNTQEMDDDEDEALETLLCNPDESTRQSVVKCVALMPDVRLEIIKECEPRLANVEEDVYEKMLDLYCNEKDGSEEVEECVSQMYETGGMDQHAHVKPVIDCMKALVTKK